MIEFGGQTHEQVKAELEANAKVIAKMSKAEQERFFAEITVRSEKSYLVKIKRYQAWRDANQKIRADALALDDAKFKKGQGERTSYLRPGATN